MGGTEALIAATLISTAATTAVAVANKPKAPGLPKLPDAPEPGKAPDTSRYNSTTQARSLLAGRQGTILTSPQGLGSDGASPRKTLLGG